MSQEKRSAPDFVGTVLEGMYRIVSQVGEGGMGTVYDALHLRLHKRVAVKVMAVELAANAEALGRFHREAMVTSALGHPHIVQVFDFSTTPSGEPFLVMEFLEGEDLEHRLRRVGRLSPADTLALVKQVASALAATHTKKIVHRDLKPANIYLLEVAGATDFVKVLDFGISKVRAATTKLTHASAVMGTPNYMSPEQALGRVDEVDERTDQWALGCIAWECLSGRGPFVGENVSSILYQVVHEPPPALVPEVLGLPPEVEEVLRCALAKDKHKRFASVDAFSSALEAAMGSPVQARSGSASVSRTELLSDADRASQPGAKHRTTFTQTAGELDDSMVHRRAKSRRIWAAAGGVLVASSLVMLLVLRPGSDGKSVVSVPDALLPPSNVLSPQPDTRPDVMSEPPPRAHPLEDQAQDVESRPAEKARPGLAPRPRPRPKAPPAPQPTPVVTPPLPTPPTPPTPPPSPAKPRRRLIKDL